MILFRHKPLSQRSAHLKIPIYIYSKAPARSIRSTMDSGNNQQKKEGEKQFSIQPINESNVDPKFAAHQAHPGPAMAKEMPPQQGTKEERQARKEELNK
ncbi:hypothetical protein V8C26DRAFT_387745 [Trichoderma gracile]